MDQRVKNLPAMQEDTGEVGLIPGSEDLLEEGMATYSNILASPWKEEAGRLQSMGSQRVRHD